MHDQGRSSKSLPDERITKAIVKTSITAADLVIIFIRFGGVY
jgi:hypothetical protein